MPVDPGQLSAFPAGNRKETLIEGVTEISVTPVRPFSFVFPNLQASITAQHPFTKY